MSTETALRDWRAGPTNAERLCAGVLELAGFSDVEPQAPLGGSDGTKDILARRDGLLWVAAVYFPPTHQDFKSVRSKFVDDLVGWTRMAQPASRSSSTSI